MTYREVMPDGTVRLTGAQAEGQQGSPGAEGPPGPGLEPKFFYFTTPATSWPFPHNFNQRNVDITLYDVNGNEIIAGRHMIDDNNARASFYYATAGSARVSK